LILLPESLCPWRCLEQILSIALPPETVTRLAMAVPVFRDPLREPSLHFGCPMI
jgi:hypothetical protein